MSQDDTSDSQDFSGRHDRGGSAERSNPVSRDKREPLGQRRTATASTVQTQEPEWSPDGSPHDFSGETGQGTGGRRRMAERMGRDSASSGNFDRTEMRMMQPPRMKNSHNQDTERRRGTARQGWLGNIFGHDPTTRKLMGGALAVVLVLVSIVGVWAALGGRHQDIPVIGPPPLPVKDRPTDPGGMQIMSDDTAIEDISGNGKVHLAPQPEQPDAGILARRGQMQNSSQQSGADSKTDTASMADKLTTIEGQSGADTAPQDIGKMAGPSSSGASSAPVTRQDGSPDSAAGVDEETQSASPLPSSPPPSARKNSAPEAVTDNRQETDRTERAKRAIKSSDIPATTSRDEVEKAAGRSGRYEVQLAALDSEARARKQWASLKSKAPELLGQRNPVYSKTQRNGQNFVRVRIGGFADLSEARSFCIKLHARSLPCTPAAF